MQLFSPPRGFLAVLLFFCIGALQGCRGRGREGESGAAGTGGSQTYQLKGIVVSADAKNGTVMVDSEAIPNFMEAMVMPYKLAQPGVAGELHPGDHIIARLTVNNSESLLDQIDVTKQARLDYKPAKVYNVPAPGQVVPDFKFVNQDGKTISIDQFRGQVLLVTFIYTRCPLPDYCIRMSRNFADVQHQLSADSDMYRRTHLLSVSFDPAYDTPKVLRSYGDMYAGAAGFRHWDFAVPPAAEVNTVDEFFDVGASPGPNHTITHTLSTAVITPEGKIFRWYPTNEWTPATVVGDIKQAVAQ